MTTIMVAHEVSEDVFMDIYGMLCELYMTEPKWSENDDDLCISRGEITCIPDNESEDAVDLLNKIKNMIAG